MLNLPEQTKLNRSLPKTAIYKNLMLNSGQKEKFDADISKISIINEISEKTVNIKTGDEIKSIFVLHVVLKQENFDKNNIIMLSKLVPQNIIYLLEFEGQFKLAVYHTKLLETSWQLAQGVSLVGLNLDGVWENIIRSIGDIQIQDENTLEEQILLDEENEKRLKQIMTLENKMHKTKQFNEKVKLKHEIQRLKEQKL